MIAPRRRKIHLIGIGGIGMCGAARLFLEMGDEVSGTDARESPSTRDIALRGATVHIGHRSAYVPADADLVVRSAAVPDTNPEVLTAMSRGTQVVKYAEVLPLLMSGRRGVAIAGTHGKTTTSSMTAVVLQKCGLDPAYILGGVVPSLDGNARWGHGGPFVVEACEFDRSFLHLSPEIGAVMNVDEDHLDCYRDLGEIHDAFREFGRRVRPGGLLLVHESAAPVFRGESAAAIRRVTFGFSEKATWRATDIRREDERTHFTVWRRGERYGEFSTGLAGLHNVSNALVPIAISERFGVDPARAARGLASFKGVRRRLERRVAVRRCALYDDYAHHPTEIRASLAALRRERAGAKLFAVFQPHQYSRTRQFLDGFADALLDADRVLVAEIFRARDRDEDVAAVNGGQLADAVCARGGNAIHLAEFGAIAERLSAEIGPGDVVVTMGAGNIDEVADEMARRLDG